MKQETTEQQLFKLLARFERRREQEGGTFDLRGFHEFLKEEILKDLED